MARSGVSKLSSCGVNMSRFGLRKYRTMVRYPFPLPLLRAIVKYDTLPPCAPTDYTRVLSPARPPPPSSPCSLPPSLALSSPLPHLPHQFDGYMAAVPSKHDLASFVRSIHVELALAVPAGSINAGIGGGGGLASEAEVAAGGGALGAGARRRT